MTSLLCVLGRMPCIIRYGPSFVCLTQRKTLMTKRVAGKLGRRALWISPVVIVIGGFIAVLHWLKPQNATFVIVLSAAVSIFVMGYCSFLAHRMQQRLDEVQIAHQQFANSRG